MLGVALVGCGKVAEKYFDILCQKRIPNADLVCICDIDSKKSSYCGHKYEIPYYDNVHNMMEAEGSKIGLIAILTPSGLHAKNAIELVKYGKPLMVEKPMALTLADADAMINACDQAGVKLFVVKQNRFNVPITKLREAIEEQRFGKMVMGTVRVQWCRRQSYYDQASWRGTWQYDGGVFANQAIHHIDLLQWMMGPVESIYAKSSTRLVDIETEDTGVAILKFTSGALGVIEATTATRPVDVGGSISILGEKGTVEIGGFAANEMNIWNFSDDTKKEQENIINNYGKNPESINAYAHQEYLSNVVDSVHQGKKSSLVDGLAGRKSLELITAIYESIETNKEVIVNFSPKKCRLGLA